MCSGGSGRACKANPGSTEQGVSQLTLTTLETVELRRFEPWICVVYRPDKQRTLFGFALGSALAESVDPVRAMSFVVELLAVQTCYFTKGQRLSIEIDVNWMQCARSDAS
jgi:hypothetical protein